MSPGNRVCPVLRICIHFKLSRNWQMLTNSPASFEQKGFRVFGCATWARLGTCSLLIYCCFRVVREAAVNMPEVSVCFCFLSEISHTLSCMWWEWMLWFIWSTSYACLWFTWEPFTFVLNKTHVWVSALLFKKFIIKRRFCHHLLTVMSFQSE